MPMGSELVQNDLSSFSCMVVDLPRPGIEPVPLPWKLAESQPRTVKEVAGHLGCLSSS